MAIFRKTEPGLLYELSPGRDGRLLVWSPGLMKYKDCTSLADMSNVNSNYLEQDIDDGCWFYQLPSLVNGDNMFYNANNGRVPLWHFEANLQSLQSGVNMFKGCSLDVVSIQRIADTLPATSTGTLTLGIHYTLEGDSSVAALLTKIANKGWSVETEYNLPYGFTELEYIEGSGTQYILSGIVPNEKTGVEIVAQSISNTNTQIPAGVLEVIRGRTYREQPPFLNALRKALEAGIWSLEIVWKNLGSNFDYNQKYHSTFNLFNSQRSTLDVAGVSYYDSDASENFNTYPAQLQGNVVLMGRETYPNNIAYKFVGRMWLARMSQANELIFDGVPVLDENGTPCMYDKIFRKCHYNDGTGTFGYKIKRTGDEVAPFSLRDPYYVAPSGVYARPSGENELDIIADTDMTEDIAEQEGYIWFANTGEAYEHFGITQQSEEGEVIEA